MCEVEDSGGRRINRMRKEGASLRRVKKVIEKTNWYKERRKYIVDDGKNRRLVRGGQPIPREVNNRSTKEEKNSKPYRRRSKRRKISLQQAQD